MKNENDGVNLHPQQKTNQSFTFVPHQNVVCQSDSFVQIQQSASRRRLLNETGQMSVFIALMFQVLFVFFAMVINVGLLVHDKINLQNSVDLGAYYGAQKQAELLEEMAHINYQIRQDNKLLVWRYRVLGTLGRGNSPAVVPDANPIPKDVPIPPRQPAPGLTSEPPVVCVAHRMWKEFGDTSTRDENYCHQQYGSQTPGIPTVTVINPFLTMNAFIASASKQSQGQLQDSCNEAAPLNWTFTMQMIYAYRQAIAERKMLIHAMRENFIAADPLDIDGSSVKTGITATVVNNLTQANAKSSPSISVLNSMTLGGCDGNDGEFMMPEVSIAPLLKFTYSVGPGGQSGCNFSVLYHTQWPAARIPELKAWDPTGIMLAQSLGEPPAADPTHSSLGYEKNPWCMTYVGVKASSSPRKPFAPFGTPVTLQARAFAQPFGGRVGPWYGARWPRGAAISDSSEDSRTDKLTTPRLLPGGSDVTYTEASMPNYSRYPGDPYGMSSQLAQSSVRGTFNKVGFGDGKTASLSLKFYTTFANIPQTGDPLIWSQDVQENTPIAQAAFAPFRNAEVSALAPDLFDATYYSIDPTYYANFQQRHLANAGRYALQPLFGVKSSPISDLGSRADNQTLASFNVQTQILTGITALDPKIGPTLYWPIRAWQHLLTSWSPNLVSNFEFPDSRFAVCPVPATDAVPIPGACAAGGRSGYSVRLVSREHLLLDDWQVGGDGEGAGGIMNKPALDF